MFKVRLVSPWPKQVILDSGTIVSSDIDLQDADGLLCYWAPSSELFEFSGPRLWYNCEPQWCFDQIDGGEFSKLASSLPENMFVNHRAKNAALRVPHVTHWGSCEVSDSTSPRINKAISIVSNNGGGQNWIHQGLKLRNKFATASKVDLYGSEKAWRNFSGSFWGQLGPPKNYKGEIPSDDGKWHGQQKRKLQASYKVSNCLENVCEENYFTEKFVEAVLAGCVPVYQADRVVAETYLQGAVWVDPADHGFKPGRTIRAALNLDREEVASKNKLWLATNGYLASTEGTQILERLAAILRSQ